MDMLGTLRALEVDVRKGKHMATFAAAKVRYPVLAPIDRPASVLLSFSLGGRESASAKEDMTRALICEQQLHPHPLWVSLLACVYAPMLRHFRGRLSAPGTEAEELDQIVMAGFMWSIAAFPLPYSLGHTALFLRQMTARVVFGYLKSQRLMLRLFVPTSPGELDDTECANPAERVFTGPLPHDHRREADALIELLFDAAGPGFTGRQLHLVAETVIRGESLDSYVRRDHPPLDDDGLARAWERLKRQRTRLLGRLQRPLYKLPGHNGSRNNLRVGARQR